MKKSDKTYNELEVSWVNPEKTIGYTSIGTYIENGVEYCCSDKHRPMNLGFDLQPISNIHSVNFDAN